MKAPERPGGGALHGSTPRLGYVASNSGETLVLPSTPTPAGGQPGSLEDLIGPLLDQGTQERRTSRESEARNGIRRTSLRVLKRPKHQALIAGALAQQEAAYEEILDQL
ncbi:hypothetical protein N7522_002786 [Penicillium canescens]|uniref:Uncharacterized protein n=1 Tax=Penicillium canescens TaxID=5083 RepID=A0AAD6ND55_PENCN|nr:uncharacterized protein N7446_007154 [Penicillium canescens]KAJ6012431.1 hypothetical protein N7522_002786 [Penicillium canescens]KAJ6049517.1 hypothetical protein N7444_006233 [Penicillium canescens]KAJ6052514.1 hypothetical protein N7460_003048 [Penicillium canescens]KAJ6063034.1 hypothetical protein N7446_007154 [Penicillium canescens]